MYQIKKINLIKKGKQAMGIFPGVLFFVFFGFLDLAI
jgi:hypothetical protein